MAEMVQLGALSLKRRTENLQPPKVKQNVPAYRVGGKGFYDQFNRLWFAGEALYFEDEPNEDMIALNKLAYDRLQLLYDKLDECEEKFCRQNKKQFVKRPRVAWDDENINVAIPLPDSVFGVKKHGSNIAIN